MNISFFLKPKAEVSYLHDDATAKDAMEILLQSGFASISMINAKGNYICVINEGDFLRLALEKTPEEMQQIIVRDVPRRTAYKAVKIDARMEDLVDLVSAQNFVPVIDGRDKFIGIITRRDVLLYLKNQLIYKSN